MPRFIAAVVALVVLAAAILIIAPGLIPVSAYKGRLEQAASEALGRAVTIGDDLSLKIVPRTAFRVTDLEIANAEGFEAPYLARVKEADIGVKLIPLLSGAVEVNRFVLTEPELNLAVAADGSVNWNLAQGAGDEDEGASGSELKDLRLGDVRLVDGRATFADAKAGKTYTIENIDAEARLDSLNEPLEIDGSMIFEGSASEIDLVLSSPGAIMRKEPAKLKLAATLGKASAGADLAIAGGETLSYSGPIKVEAPDLPALAALVGVELAEAPGFDSLSVDGEVEGGGDGARLSGATIKFDEIDAAGDLALAWDGPRPKATGALNVGTLDLRPYMPPPAEAETGFPAWSEDRLDFSSLNNIDADLDISAEKIFLNEMEFGESRMRLVIENGRMVAEIPELGMYGGAGSGRLVVNARSATPSFQGAFDLGAVKAQPFAEDVLKNDRLLGLGGFKLDFSASGSSQAAIMRSLDGSGGFELSDGAIKGVNIAKMARAIGEIQKSGLNPASVAGIVAQAQSPAEQTDFSEFLSQFDINDGVVNAPQIALVGPFLNMAGTGSVNLPAQTLDLRLAPKAMTTIDGEGGQAYTIPMRITGTFSEPKIMVDVEALLRGRVEQGLQNMLGNIGRSREEGGGDPARSLLEGLIGGGRSAPPPAQDSAETQGEAAAAPQQSASPEETIARDALKRLFGTRGNADQQAEESAEDQPQ